MPLALLLPPASSRICSAQRRRHRLQERRAAAKLEDHRCGGPWFSGRRRTAPGPDLGFGGRAHCRPPRAGPGSERGPRFVPPVFSAEVVVARTRLGSEGRHQRGTGASLPSPLELEVIENFYKSNHHHDHAPDLGERSRKNFVVPLLGSKQPIQDQPCASYGVSRNRLTGGVTAGVTELQNRLFIPNVVALAKLQAYWLCGGYAGFLSRLIVRPLQELSQYEKAPKGVTVRNIFSRQPVMIS